MAAAGGHIGTPQLLLDRDCRLEDRDHGHIHGPGKTPLLVAAKQRLFGCWSTALM